MIRSLLLTLLLLVPTLASAAPTIWHPPAGTSGWFPKISPDGTYVAMGQGRISVYNRTTGKLVAVNYASVGDRAFSGHWLSATDLTVMVENDAAKAVTTYKLSAPDFATWVKLGIAGTDNCAGAGHWAVSRPMAGIVYYDGTPLPGEGRSMGCDMDPATGIVVHNFRNGPNSGNFKTEDWSIRTYNSSRTLLRDTRPPKGSPNIIRVGAGGYVGYGYYGTSHMLTPAGAYLDITVTSPAAEGPGKAFLHKGVVWVATSGDGGIYLRPIGDKRVIVVPIPTVRVEAVSAGDTFVVAGNGDRGQLGVAVIPDTTPRAVIEPVVTPPPVTPPPVTPPPVTPPPTEPEVPEVECGQFTTAEKEVLKRIGALFPELRKSAEDDGRRQFNEKLAQQLDYSFPTKGWGMKKASDTRPISKDSVARKIDGALCGWDTVNGSTREMNLNARGEVLDPDQRYVDVSPVNHLGGGQPPVDTPPPSNDGEVAKLKARITELEAQLAASASRVTELEAERDALKAERAALHVEVDQLKQRVAQLENAPPPSCQAKVPGFLRALGIRVGCEIVKP